MRTKELKPNTDYATSNGQMVRTMDTVERGWYSFREIVERPKGPNSAVLGPLQFQQGPPGGEADLGDPWAERERDRRNASRKYKQVTEGIRATLLVPDKDGKAVLGKEVLIVIDPKDIKGTWAKYLELHSDAIKIKYMTHEANLARQAEELRLVRLLQAAKVDGLQNGDSNYGSSTAVNVSTIWTVRDKAGKESETTWLSGGETPLSWRFQTRLSLSGKMADNVIELLGEGDV